MGSLLAPTCCRSNLKLVKQDATHNINGTSLDIVTDEAHDGTWTASWWYPLPMGTGSMEWADCDGAGYPTREAAEQAAIEWARAHGPQR